MKRPSYGRIALLLAAIILVAALLAWGVGDLLTLDQLKARRSGLAESLAARPAEIAGGFFLLYVAVTALSLPGAAVMSLAGGAVFGLWAGVLLVSFASTLGATLAFLASRYLFRDWVERRFGARLKAIDRGMARDGTLYLLSLRLNPVVPYFLVNLGMGLTRIGVLRFALVSQLGMLPATFVYVNAGTQLARIRELGDILSPQLIGSLVLLSLFPLIGKWAAGAIRRRRAYKGWRRPRRFDRNLVVIGAGSGGLVTAYIAAAVKAKVTLIEADEMGGECLNTGCVPSKALIRAARAAHEVRTAGRFGVEAGTPEVDFPAVMRRVRGAIEEIAPNDSVERYRGLGVDVRRGYARIVDPWTVEVGAERLATRAIVLATGAEAAVPDIPGLADSGYLTSDTMWDALAARAEPPRRLVIVGGGPVGTEMAQAFARLGTAVTLVQSHQFLLPKEDDEVGALIAETLRAEGVEVRTGEKALRVEGKSLVTRKAPPLDGEGLGRGERRRLRGIDESTPTLPSPIEGEGFDGETSIPFDDLLVAVGRKPRLAGYGLEALGIGTEGRLETNAWLETLYPNIYAVGDVEGSHLFTHAASHQAWHAAVNALFGAFRRFRIDYSVLPRVTFTDPEVAHVGDNEASAREAGVEYELVRYDLARLDRAVAEGAAEGFVKLLVRPGGDRILGATIVGERAGELIAEVALALKHGIGLRKLLATIHAYPTFAEAVPSAAGEWRRANAPERLLRWAGRYHSWRRG